MSQSATVNNNEAQHGPYNAIDMDMHTQAYTLSGTYTNAWFKASLDADYCIERVIVLYTIGDLNIIIRTRTPALMTSVLVKELGAIDGPSLCTVKMAQCQVLTSLPGAKLETS